MEAEQSNFLGIAINELVATVAELADQLTELRRRVEQLEQSEPAQNAPARAGGLE